jgi:malonyl-CoA O-methyltransferase
MSAAVLSARAAYPLWAASYDQENVVTTLEDAAVAQLTPSLEGKRILDAACGTARRLRDRGQPSVRVGVDLVPEMLQQSHGNGIELITGDVRQLPVVSAAFDVVWCRLAIGHVAELELVYNELARALAPGGTLIVTDFHPAAVAAGHTRSFRNADGELITVDHHVHDRDAHAAAAHAAGLAQRDVSEARIGPTVQHLYAQAGASARYERDLGLPLVLALSYSR